MSMSIFRNMRFSLVFSLEPSFSLKTSGNCSKGSWKKNSRKRFVWKWIWRAQTHLTKPLIRKLPFDNLALKKRYTSRVQHIKNTHQTLNEVEIVLYFRRRMNATVLRIVKKWQKLRRSKIKPQIISNLTCLFLDLIFALSRAISRHNARIWDKLQCCSAYNKMA